MPPLQRWTGRSRHCVSPDCGTETPVFRSQPALLRDTKPPVPNWPSARETWRLPSTPRSIPKLEIAQSNVPGRWIGPTAVNPTRAPLLARAAARLANRVAAGAGGPEFVIASIMCSTRQVKCVTNSRCRYWVHISPTFRFFRWGAARHSASLFKDLDGPADRHGRLTSVSPIKEAFRNL